MQCDVCVPSFRQLTDRSRFTGTCVRDYIHVTDLVNAHIDAIPHMESDVVSWLARSLMLRLMCWFLFFRFSSYFSVNDVIAPQVKVYNVGVGKGYSVREFVNACLKVNQPERDYLSSDMVLCTASTKCGR